MPRHIAFLLFLLVTFVPHTRAADIFSILPKDNEVSGWKWAEKPRRYVSQQLWEYIDGGADVYLDFGFKQVGTVDLESRGRRITVDVFEMRSIDDAFGIYASERSPSYNFIAMGAEGYTSGSSLIFYQDRYYVKINGSATDAQTRSALQQIARGMSQRIGSARKQPAALAMFPKQGRAKHSETRAHAAFLGQASMKGAFTAEITTQGRKMTAFIFIAPSAATAAARVRQFKTTMSSPGSIDAAVRDIGADTFASGRHGTARELVVASKGKVVFGAYPAVNAKAAEELMTQIAAGIRK